MLVEGEVVMSALIASAWPAARECGRPPARYDGAVAGTPSRSCATRQLARGVLFAGDAVIGVKPGHPAGIELPPDWTCDDAPASPAAASALVPSLPPHRAILPSHGEPIANATPELTRGLWEALRA